jgi:hypothetical protein
VEKSSGWLGIKRIRIRFSNIPKPNRKRKDLFLKCSIVLEFGAFGIMEILNLLIYVHDNFEIISFSPSNSSQPISDLTEYLPFDAHSNRSRKAIAMLTLSGLEPTGPGIYSPLPLAARATRQELGVNHTGGF